MARIVSGLAMSHSPFIMTNAKDGGEKGERFIQKMGEMKKWLTESGVDVIVLVSDDHFNSYYYNLAPTFTIGIGTCEGWGDWELPPYNIPVEKELARHILDTGLESGVDFAFTMSMKVDHGHTQAIYFLDPELNVPVVPIAVNTVAPPVPTMDRCYQLGEVLRKAIQSWNTDKKVAVIASGGLSHWVPIPKLDSKKEEDQMMIEIMLHGREKVQDSEEYKEFRKNRVTRMKSGPVNEEWDRWFLDLIVKGDTETLRKITFQEIEENAGNGGQELHNWLVLLGAVQGMNPEIVCYEPIPEWVTGMGIVKFE